MAGWQDAPIVQPAGAGVASGQPAWMTAPVVEAEPPQSGVASQFGAGSQRGIANAAGFPVDAVAGAISGLGGLTGMWGPIENPVGGSESIYSLMEPLHGQVAAPQTGGQRVARRMGEEVGASATMAPLGLATAAGQAAPGVFAAVEGASALGSGAGAAAANEMFPGSATADVIGSLMGGLPAGYAASRMTGSAPVVVDGMDDLKDRASQAYGAVRADQTVVDPQSTGNMAAGIQARMAGEKMNPRLHPKAAAALEVIMDDVGKPLRIEDIEQIRRYAQRNVSSSIEPEERRLGQIMVEEITSYLDGLKPADMAGGVDPSPVVSALTEGRKAARAGMAAKTVDAATSKAQRRAASTGSGGNEINAIRQNIRGILDNPRKLAGFKPEEVAAMEAVVMGTPAGNIARSASRIAPSSGGLSAMLGVGGAMANPAIALPVMAVGEAGKYLGERSTRQSADDLVSLLAPDRVLSPGDAGLSPIIRALLAGRAVANDE